MTAAALLLLFSGVPLNAAPPPSRDEFEVGVDPFPVAAQPQVDGPVAVPTPCNRGMFFYCLRSRAHEWIQAAPIITRVRLHFNTSGQIYRCLRFEDSQFSSLADLACQWASKAVPGARAFRPNGLPEPVDVLLNWAAPENIASFSGQEPAQPPRLILNGYSTEGHPCQPLVCPEDYPTSALVALEQGQVYYFARINSHGQATSCWPFIVTGHRQLSQRTCRIIVHRARFEPATDAEGHAVEAIYTGIMRWEIPE